MNEAQKKVKYEITEITIKFNSDKKDIKIL